MLFTLITISCICMLMIIICTGNNKPSVTRTPSFTKTTVPVWGKPEYRRGGIN